LILTLSILMLTPLTLRKHWPPGAPGFLFPKSHVGWLLTVSYVVTSLLVYTYTNSAEYVKIGGVVLLNNLNDLRYLLLISGLVPFAEELFFRSFAYSLQNVASLENWQSGKIWKELQFAYINGLIFWVFHLPGGWDWVGRLFENGQVMLPLGPFFLGVVCAWVALRDRSIWWPIVLHGCANASAPFWSEFLRQHGVFEFFYF
jgi:membrane protease YdiL (CAAX protease family)